MLKNPQCMKLLKDEIKDLLPADQNTNDFIKQANMPYLNACM